MKRMDIHRLGRFLYILIGVSLLAACSTTKHLPEGEILYIGQRPTLVDNPQPTSVGETALEEVEAALAKAPNNSLLGSTSVRIPFPLGLWVYNGFQKYEKGLGRWIFNRFAAEPVLLSGVNPDIRTQAATNLLHDYGYFQGKVTHQVLPHAKDSLKARVQYSVNMGRPYFIDTVDYRGFSSRTLAILKLSRRRSLISPGEQFNVPDLDGERTRISNLLRNVGCYYFRPDYLTYQADTTLVPGHVSLRLVPVAGMPEVAEKPFRLGRKSFHLLGKNGEAPNDSLVYKDLTIYFHDKLRVRPNMVHRWMDYQNFRYKRQVEDSAGISRQRSARSLYSLYRQTRVQERLANVGIFKYTEMQYVPRDSALVNDTLDVHVIASLDKPYDAELDFNVKMKSNNQTGPGAAFTLTKNNVFGGGEKWNVELKGSYEWATGKNSSSAMNSYELGVATSLIFPRVVFPRMGGNEYDFPATTTFRLYADQVNRARYYKLLAFGGNATYDFQPKPTSKHSFTPFRLTFNVLRDPTAEFQQLQEENPALYVSLRNQFIPAMEYTYTFDNSAGGRRRRPIWWQTTLTSAGNVTSLIYRALGQPFSEEGKELLGVPFAQFLKVNTELRYNHRIDRNNSLAARAAVGVIWSYGNATTAPYTEQFYVGGANSVRAFAARNIGPGGYPADDNDTYSFINHVGDIRFEANLEYRFRIISDLHGAVFLDAGNVWLMRRDPSRPGGEFRLKDFPKQIALGTGVGIRYDLDFLVFRLDWGIALHEPYDTGKSGYYNVRKFMDGTALHFAIGYPF
ncbi:MAG TPA: BamA/TamA family outer membrane protein [Candidatus Bacteroides pullicola]|uniref:BamA/TamA family outer membrane protein n=1 Tax=Candidatus Bacteroides pullicola TaxID=2838475 RepID=A0A9D1ZJ47_9BACE|nr:BamA/TamA family outer membrane protein [Candidatus Bacteroides pullicola]